VARKPSPLGGNQLVSQNGQGGPSVAQRNRRALKYCHQTLADAQDKWAESLVYLMTEHPEGMVRVVALKLFAERVWGSVPKQVAVSKQENRQVEFIIRDSRSGNVITSTNQDTKMLSAAQYVVEGEVKDAVDGP
jgi:hypothetical protein